MLKQRTFFSLLMTIIQQAVGYVALYFISRYMGPEALGTVSSALAFCSVFLIFGNMGYGLAHMKKVSEGVDLAKCNGTFLTIKAILTLLIGIICLITIKVTEMYGGKLPVPDNQISVLYIILVSVLIGNMTQAFNGTFAARLEKVKEWSSLFSTKFVSASLKTISAILGLSVFFLAYSSLAGSIVGFLIAIWFFRKLPIAKPDWNLFIEYTKFAMPAFFIGISATLAMQLDKVFINLFSDVTQVGLYTAAQSIVMMITFISTIFISLLFPTFSRLHANNDIKGIRLLSNRIERYISFPLMAAGIFVYFFSPQIQYILLGDKFVVSANIIKILIINAMLLIFAQPYTSQIIGMGRIKLATLLSIFVLILNIIFYVIFIPESFLGINMMGLGGRGAALSLLVSNIIGTNLFRYYAFKISGAKPNLVILSHLVVSVVTFGIINFFLKDLSQINNIIVLTGVALIGGFIYLTILALLKQFTKNDFNYYLNVVDPVKMMKYVVSEVKE